MKTIPVGTIPMILAITSIFANVTFADHETAIHRETISRCFIYEAFNPELMHRIEKATGSVVQYDLNLWTKETVALFFKEGNTVVEKTVTTKLPSTKPFAAYENQGGNEATLAKEIRFYLFSHEYHVCKD